MPVDHSFARLLRHRLFGLERIVDDETGFLGPETNRPKSHSGQKQCPRRPKRSRKSPPIAGFLAVSGKFAVRMRGGGCSAVRTCLSLQLGKMQGDFGELQARPRVIEIKANRSQEFGSGPPYSRSRETIIRQQGRELRIAKSRITLRRSRQFVRASSRDAPKQPRQSIPMTEFVPNGYISIHEALNHLGRELFPSEWTGEEHTARTGLISADEWLKMKDLPGTGASGGGMRPGG